MSPKAKRIGIFDDEERVVLDLQVFLNGRANSDEQPIVAEICSNARDVENFCRDFRPDLALLDLWWENQPVAYSDIEKVLQARGIPVVYLSGRVSEGTASKSAKRIIARPKSSQEVFDQLVEWDLV